MHRHVYLTISSVGLCFLSLRMGNWSSHSSHLTQSSPLDQKIEQLKAQILEAIKRDNFSEIDPLNRQMAQAQREKLALIDSPNNASSQASPGNYRINTFRFLDHSFNLNAECSYLLLADANLRMVLATHNAFHVPYNNASGIVQKFLEKLELCRKEWKQGILYAAYLSVIQASMMGKTRMLCTLPEHDVFVFYICLRDEKSSGYPRSIPELMRALTSSTCTEGFYAAFVLAALDALQAFITEHTRRKSALNVYTEWFKSQQDPRFWTPIISAWHNFHNCPTMF